MIQWLRKNKNMCQKMEEQEADVMLPEMRKASWLIRQKKTNGPNVVPTILVEHII